MDTKQSFISFGLGLVTPKQIQVHSSTQISVKYPEISQKINTNEILRHLITVLFSKQKFNIDLENNI